MNLPLKRLLLAALCAGSVLGTTLVTTAAEEKAAPPPPAKDGPPPGERGPGGGRGRMDPAQRIKMMSEELNLTQEQKDKILPIIQATAEKMKAVPEDQRRTEGQKLRAAEREQIGALLTPEQKTKFEQMNQRRPGGPGGPGGGQGRREGAGGPPPPAEHKD